MDGNLSKKLQDFEGNFGISLLEFQKIYQPLQTAQQYGAGITPLIAGYPQQTTTQVTPSPTALQTGLGTLATLAGIYKSFQPTQIKLF